MSVELNTLVREVAADYPQADPRELARHIAKLTPAEHVEAFYTEALVPVIRALLIQQRNSALGNALNPPKSSKLAERRDWWAKMVEGRVHVGEGQWKRLGDCTIDDLSFIVQERRDGIAELQAQISKYERLIGLMEQHKAKTVARLPKGVFAL